MTKELLQQDSALLLRMDQGSAQADVDAGEIVGFGPHDWRAANNLLSALRKCCNHPFLFDGLEQAAAAMSEGLIEASGKLRVLDRLLCRLIRSGHRAVIFAQSTSTLDILQRYCDERGYEHARLDGATNRVKRNLDVRSFQSSTFYKIFLVSTRAGGLGINLTSADNVIMYDSDFNPQVDKQAIDRCHRIGQTRPVTAWRLVSRGSVEERIVKRAADKLGLEVMVTGQGDVNEAIDQMQDVSAGRISKADTLNMLRDAASGAFSKESAPDRLTEDEVDLLIDAAEQRARKKLERDSNSSRESHSDRHVDRHGKGRGGSSTAASSLTGGSSGGSRSSGGKGRGRGRGRGAPAAGGGRAAGKRPSSVYEAIEQGQVYVGKRQVKQRSVSQGGDTVLIANLEPSSTPAPPPVAKKVRACLMRDPLLALRDLALLF